MTEVGIVQGQKLIVKKDGQWMVIAILTVAPEIFKELISDAWGLHIEIVREG
jgi:hypothetical protein